MSKNIEKIKIKMIDKILDLLLLLKKVILMKFWHGCAVLDDYLIRFIIRINNEIVSFQYRIILKLTKKRSVINPEDYLNERAASTPLLEQKDSTIVQKSFDLSNFFSECLFNLCSIKDAYKIYFASSKFNYSFFCNFLQTLYNLFLGACNIIFSIIINFFKLWFEIELCFFMAFWWFPILVGFLIFVIYYHIRMYWHRAVVIYYVNILRNMLKLKIKNIFYFFVLQYRNIIQNIFYFFDTFKVFFKKNLKCIVSYFTNMKPRYKIMFFNCQVCPNLKIFLYRIISRIRSITGKLDFGFIKNFFQTTYLSVSYIRIRFRSINFKFVMERIKIPWSSSFDVRLGEGATFKGMEKINQGIKKSYNKVGIFLHGPETIRRATEMESRDMPGDGESRSTKVDYKFHSLPIPLISQNIFKQSRNKEQLYGNIGINQGNLESLFQVQDGLSDSEKYWQDCKFYTNLGTPKPYTSGLDKSFIIHLEALGYGDLGLLDKEFTFDRSGNIYDARSRLVPINFYPRSYEIRLNTWRYPDEIDDDEDLADPFVIFEKYHGIEAPLRVFHKSPIHIQFSRNEMIFLPIARLRDFQKEKSKAPNLFTQFIVYALWGETKLIFLDRSGVDNLIEFIKTKCRNQLIFDFYSYFDLVFFATWEVRDWAFYESFLFIHKKIIKFRSGYKYPERIGRLFYKRKYYTYRLRHEEVSELVHAARGVRMDPWIYDRKLMQVNSVRFSIIIKRILEYKVLDRRFKHAKKPTTDFYMSNKKRVQRKREEILHDQILRLVRSRRRFRYMYNFERTKRLKLEATSELLAIFRKTRYSDWRDKCLKLNISFKSVPALQEKYEIFSYSQIFTNYVAFNIIDGKLKIGTRNKIEQFHGSVDYTVLVSYMRDLRSLTYTKIRFHGIYVYKLWEWQDNQKIVRRIQQAEDYREDSEKWDKWGNHVEFKIKRRNVYNKYGDARMRVMRHQVSCIYEALNILDFFSVKFLRPAALTNPVILDKFSKLEKCRRRYVGRLTYYNKRMFKFNKRSRIREKGLRRYKGKQNKSIKGKFDFLYSYLLDLSERQKMNRAQASLTWLGYDKFLKFDYEELKVLRRYLKYMKMLKILALLKSIKITIFSAFYFYVHKIFESMYTFMDRDWLYELAELFLVIFIPSRVKILFNTFGHYLLRRRNEYKEKFYAKIFFYIHLLKKPGYVMRARFKKYAVSLNFEKQKFVEIENYLVEVRNFSDIENFSLNNFLFFCKFYNYGRYLFVKIFNFLFLFCGYYIILCINSCLINFEKPPKYFKVCTKIFNFFRFRFYLIFLAACFYMLKIIRLFLKKLNSNL